MKSEWIKYENGRFLSPGLPIEFRFRAIGKKTWVKSDDIINVPEPNYLADRSADSAVPIDFTAYNHTLILTSENNETYLEIDGNDSVGYDIEYRIIGEQPSSTYSPLFIAAFQTTILSFPVFDTCQDDLKEYFELQKKNDLNSQRKKIPLVKTIISKVLGRYNKEELTGFLDSWINFEILLNVAGTRDHFIHNFETFLLGCYFLNDITPHLSPDDEINKYYFPWTLTSVMHDIGYSVEKSNAISHKIGTLYNDMGLRSISNKFTGNHLDSTVLNELYNIHFEIKTKIVGEVPTLNLREILINELTLSFNNSDLASNILLQLEETFNHGLISSILILRKILLAKGMEYSTSQSFKTISKATVAVALHHFGPKSQITLNFQEHLMLILIIISDELQEWNRPLDDFGIPNKQKRINFILDGISSTVSGNTIIFEISTKLTEYKTKQVVKIVQDIILSKKERVNSFKYNLNQKIIQINLIIKDNRGDNVHQESIFLGK